MKKNYFTMIKLLKCKKALSIFALAFMASVNLNAQTWTGATDTDFATGTNWDTGVAPIAGGAVTINPVTNNPIIGATTNAVCSTLGINAGGTLTFLGTLTPSAASYIGGTLVFDGGKLDVRNNMNFGVTSNPATITVNSGTLNARNALIVAEKGDCVLNINGGVVSVDQSNNGSTIIIGGYYAKGTVNLNGGILKTSSSKLGTLALAIQEQPTRSGTGSLIINGGTLVFTNDQSTFVNGYVTAGKIVPGPGKKIVVTVIPAIPADATATPPVLAVPAITNVTAVLINPLGIETNVITDTFSVYPNPSNGIINIAAKNNNSDNLNVSIYNLLGQQILTKELVNDNSGNYSLDVSDKLTSGAYLVNIKSDSSNHTSKIIVK